jgi:hypothetical protein
MPRLALALVVTAAFVVLGASAGAESTTVKGTGDILKLSASNASTALTVKVYGMGGPCEAHYLAILIEWGKKVAYRADGGCYTHDTPVWETSLYYVTDVTTREGKEVKCPKFRLTYNTKGRFYRASIPRACLPHAADRVTVRAEGDNYGSARGGAAGPTKRLRRG